MKTTTKKLLAELQGLLEAPSEADKHRMLAVAELGAAACVAHACGHSIADTAAGLRCRFRAFPETEWPALFDEARESVRRTPTRLAALEALIEAVQAMA